MNLNCVYVNWHKVGLQYLMGYENVTVIQPSTYVRMINMTKKVALNLLIMILYKQYGKLKIVENVHWGKRKASGDLHGKVQFFQDDEGQVSLSSKHFHIPSKEECE